MVFSSLLFVYVFLPVNLLCYACVSDIKAKNLCMLIFSLMFYAWASPLYLVLLAVMAFISYVSARLIEKYKRTVKARITLCLSLCLTLGILIYFKYLGFLCEIIDSVADVFGVIPSIILPVGISFYTFQLIAYVADVYKGEVAADRKYTNILLYASLFHQCIAGPIVRYKDIADEFKQRKANIDDVSEGISRFCVGLAKKALLANSCAAILSNVLPETLSANSTVTVAGAWFGGLLYMLHIYLDFSAYSDMAIGLGRMTGFHYRENFNYPYIAGTVTDFWRRWHISLSTFFRDYVYIPLGGNRKGLFRQIINMFIVWGLTGLWHGASYNFVLWGLYYFVFLAIEKAVLLRLFEKFKNVFTVVIGHVYTLLVVFFGWVLFRFTDFTSMKIALRAMFGLNGNVFCNMEIVTVILNNIVFIVVCIVAATPFVKWLAGKLKKRAENDKAVYMHIYNAINLAVPVLLLFLATIALVGDSYNPFIYFRF